MNYSKPALAVADQIAQLQQRGLQVNDPQLAAHFLTQVSYYRLAGYWWPLQADKTLHTFRPGTTFEQVIALYNFDRELRLLVFDAIERIEIALRTMLIYEVSHEFDPWWFENHTLFKDQSRFADHLIIIDKELANTREVFIQEHYAKYGTDTRRPPAWKTLELLSLGHMSKIYGNLDNTVRSADIIARKLKLPNQVYLRSWIQAITQIRNLCAHHSRLWNRLLPATYKLMSRPIGPWISIPPLNNHKPYLTLCCLKYLLASVSPGNTFTTKLAALFQKYPTVRPAAIGIPNNWEQEYLWVN